MQHEKLKAFVSVDYKLYGKVLHPSDEVFFLHRDGVWRENIENKITQEVKLKKFPSDKVLLFRKLKSIEGWKNICTANDDVSDFQSA